MESASNVAACATLSTIARMFRNTLIRTKRVERDLGRPGKQTQVRFRKAGSFFKFRSRNGENRKLYSKIMDASAGAGEQRMGIWGSFQPFCWRAEETGIFGVKNVKSIT